MQPNALALEYQRDYLDSRGDLNILDLINNPSASGKCSVFGLGFGEQPSNDIFLQICALGDNAPNSLLVAQNTR